MEGVVDAEVAALEALRAGARDRLQFRGRVHAEGDDAPLLLDTKGELVVAGVTNKLQMPVTMIRVGADKLKFTGSTSVKMTSFGIQPPTRLGVFSTGDDVKLTFEWLTAKKEPAK